MHINRRLDVVVAEELLDGSDIVTAFEQASCEGMPESIARGPLRQSCLRDGLFHGFLKQRFVYMMSSLLAGP